MTYPRVQCVKRFSISNVSVRQASMSHAMHVHDANVCELKARRKRAADASACKVKREEYNLFLTLVMDQNF